MGKPRVVVVDDDEDFLEELKEVLCLNGYDVEAVSDPAGALGIIEKVRPDAVLLDLRMRGKDGFEIAEELARNQETAEIPVIAMTGFCSDEELERLRRTGVVRAYLAKPFAISEVITKVKEVRRLR
jgi:CheY-like chemotaxis protein